MEFSPDRGARLADELASFNVPKELIEQITSGLGAEPSRPEAGPSPFAISWMDSYLAHWELRDQLPQTASTAAEVSELVRELVDVRFGERLAEIRDLLGAEPPDAGPPEPGVPPAGPTEPPDAGPPEPGVPPAGPAGIVFEPPDAGPPEPGVPPAGPSGIVFEPPDAGPPEPSVPPVPPAGPSVIFSPPDGGTPEPGVPPAGPASIGAGLDGENPWILYWFVSVKAPLLLDVIDAHLTRRLGELQNRVR